MCTQKVHPVTLPFALEHSLLSERGWAHVYVPAVGSCVRVLLPKGTDAEFLLADYNEVSGEFSNYRLVEKEM